MIKLLAIPRGDFYVWTEGIGWSVELFSKPLLLSACMSVDLLLWVPHLTFHLLHHVVFGCTIKHTKGNSYLSVRKSIVTELNDHVCRYATASARSDGMFLLCGGRDASGTV